MNPESEQEATERTERTDSSQDVLRQVAEPTGENRANGAQKPFSLSATKQNGGERLSRRFVDWHLVALLTILAVVSCTRDSAPVPEAQYRAKIVGDWVGTVGDMKETITFRADGHFVSQLRPMGFISNTLGEGVMGIINGTWVLQGNVITLNIINAENEHLLNKSTSGTIVSLEQNQLVLKSARGDTSMFVRAI